MRCVITRGLPGSGKSTYIKNNYPDVVACSADNAFMKNGRPAVWGADEGERP